MKYIKVGKIVNTHALKGEVRIISDFEYKNKIFKVGNTLFIGEQKDKLLIESYRVHKNFDMIKFVGIDYINDVLKYKGSYVFVDKDSLNLDENELLIDEILDMNIYSENKLIGKVSEYRSDNGNKMIRVNNKFIPFNNDFISKIDKKNSIIYMHDIEVFL